VFLDALNLVNGTSGLLFFVFCGAGLLPFFFYFAAFLSIYVLGQQPSFLLPVCMFVSCIGTPCTSLD
jgi:uncharacterized membrane protein YjjB (DUF3815 family)